MSAGSSQVMMSEEEEESDRSRSWSRSTSVSRSRSPNTSLLASASRSRSPSPESTSDPWTDEERDDHEDSVVGKASNKKKDIKSEQLSQFYNDIKTHLRRRNNKQRKEKLKKQDSTSFVIRRKRKLVDETHELGKVKLTNSTAENPRLSLENQKTAAKALKNLIWNYFEDLELAYENAEDDDNINLEKFQFFELKIILPKFLLLEIQTRNRLREFIIEVQKTHPQFLQDLDVEDTDNGINSCIIRNQSSKDIFNEVENFINRIKRQRNCLFLIVHDEAHYASVRACPAHRLLNDSFVRTATNVVVLQTTATPYTLVTKNSRIDSANIYDMYERHPAHRENYYGLEKFVKNSLKTEDSLDPGTYTTDVGFENIVMEILKILKVSY